MKRINILIIVALVMFASCSKQQTLEDKARGHLKEMAEICVNDPQSLIIQDVQVAYSTDSVCVLTYLAKSKNAFGGYVTTPMEYFYVRSNKVGDDGLVHDYHGTHSANKENAIQKMVLNFWKQGLYQTNDEKEKTDVTNNLVYTVASMFAITEGRKVE